MLRHDSEAHETTVGRLQMSAGACGIRVEVRVVIDSCDQIKRA